MDRRSMDRGITGSDLDSPAHLVRRNGSHRNHHGSMENTSRVAAYVRYKHRDILFLFDMPDRNVRPEQCLLERKTATQKEGHEIRLPNFFDLFDGGFQLAFSIDVVTGNIRPDVGIG